MKTSITDEDPGQTSRKFFHSAAVWDPTLKTVVLRDGIGAARGGIPSMDLTGPPTSQESVQLQMNGVDEDDMAVDADERWGNGDVSISVES